MDFGERLKDLRETRGFTLEEVGKYIGKDKSTVLRYETGYVDIKRHIAIKLSELYQVSPTYILGWTDSLPEQVRPMNLLEPDLAENFQSLNKDGQKMLMEYSDFLVKTGKYMKK